MNKLSDSKVKAGEKDKTPPYKMYDGDYLFLLVHQNGSKYWRYRYKWLCNKKGKFVERVYSIGKYGDKLPNITLKQARAKRDDVKELVAKGINPVGYEKRVIQERIEKSNSTFEKIARRWYNKKFEGWSQSHQREVMSSLERDIFPDLGNTLIDEITSIDLLAVLRKIEERGALVIVRKVRQRCEAIFNFAVIEGKIKENPAITLRHKDTFKTAPDKQHLRALPADKLPVLMECIENYKGEPSTKYALKFVVYTFLRTNEVRYLEWSWIDWTDKSVIIPESQMKNGLNHYLPLSNQALEILKILKPINSSSKYVFASYHKPLIQPISDGAMLNMLKNISMYEFTTVHGLRATASSILNNQKQFKSKWIERQLSHVQQNDIERAYNHADYKKQRKKMMQFYADFIDNYGKDK